MSKHWRPHTSTNATIALFFLISGCAGTSTGGGHESRLHSTQLEINKINQLMDQELTQHEGDPVKTKEINDRRLELEIAALQDLIAETRESWGLPRSPTEIDSRR